MPLQDFPQASFGNADGRKKSTAPQSPWRFFYYGCSYIYIFMCLYIYLLVVVKSLGVQLQYNSRTQKVSFGTCGIGKKVTSSPKRGEGTFLTSRKYKILISYKSKRLLQVH